MNKLFFGAILLVILFTMNLTSAAHWIIGYVEDAADATSPNGREISIMNPSSDEVFAIIGPLGMSGTSNVYMADCELALNPCRVGDILNITIVPNGSPYNSKEVVQVTVTGAGYDIVPNITMTTPFLVSSIELEDFFTSPINEIDLTPNATTKVNCSGIVETFNHVDSVSTIAATLYSSSVTVDSLDDNNNHYVNNSCFLNKSYGTTKEGFFICSFDLEYYAESTNWNCFINATDNESQEATGSDSSFVNPLLGIGTIDIINFSTVDSTKLSDEKVLEITNFGNVKINLTLSGYGESIGDGEAMVCTEENISVENIKYSVTTSSPGDINLATAEALYTNLTANPTKEAYELEARQNDVINEAKNETYWRVNVPRNVAGTCEGTIVVGATQS